MVVATVTSVGRLGGPRSGNEMPDRMQPDTRPGDWIAAGPGTPAASPGPAAGGRSGVAPLEPRLLEVLVHDLRSPLNTIKLAMHALGDLPESDPDLAEDVAMIGRNLGELERMLAVVADFSQLPTDAARLRPATFDLARLVRELAEFEGGRTPGRTIQAEIGPEPCPVELDPALATLALRTALENAARAAGDGAEPIRVGLQAGLDRCRIAVELRSRPPDSVQASALRPDLYRKLLGNSAERLGLDLAVVARVCTLFGGAARLEVQPGVGTVVSIEWPRRLTAAGG